MAKEEGMVGAIREDSSVEVTFDLSAKRQSTV